MIHEIGGLELELRETLALYVFFHSREEELPREVASLANRVRDYLYERLSIDEMEHPEKLLQSLGRDR